MVADPGVSTTVLHILTSRHGHMTVLLLYFVKSESPIFHDLYFIRLLIAWCAAFV